MTKDGVTAITLTTDEGSVTVSPEAFHRYAESLKREETMFEQSGLFGSEP
jgi:hypothetical protein